MFRTLASLMLVVVLSTSLNIDSVLAVMSYGRTPLINTEAFDMIDDGDATANIELRFGDSTKTLLYDITLAAFVFSNNVYVRGTLSGNIVHAEKTLTSSGTLTFETTGSGQNLYIQRSITGSHLNVTSTFAGANLTNCTGTTTKLTWIAATKKFGCETDETGASSGGMSYATASGIFVKRGGSFMTGSLIVTMSTGALTTASGITMAAAQNVMDITVQGGILYAGGSTVAGNDLRIFDVRNPAKPNTMGGLELSAGVREMEIAGKYLYLGTTATNEFSIYDISRPAAASLVGSLDLHINTVTALAVYGRYAYMGDSTGNFYIIDISNPALPTRVSSTAIGSSLNDIQIRDRFAYITLNDRPGLTVLDIGNPNIVKTASIAPSLPDSHAMEVKLSGKYAYTVSSTGDGFTTIMNIYDISDPRSPVSLSSMSLISISGQTQSTIDVAGDYAYVGANAGALKVIDISNPTAPRFAVSKSYGSANINKVQAHGKYLYVATDSATVIDIWFTNLPGVEAAAATFGSLLSNLLNVTDSARIGNSLSVGGAIEAGMGIHATGFSTFTSNSGAYALRIVQQSQLTGALAITAYGGTAGAHITFGSGAAFDTNLFRSAANTLKTGGSFFALGTISGTNLFSTKSITGSFIHATSTFAGAALTNCTGTSNKLTWLSATKQFGCETDQTGGGSWSNTGSLQTFFDSKYVNTSGDVMTGGLIIRVTTSDVVKTTSGTTLATDFSFAGATLLNILSSNDALTISNGTVPASGQGEVVASSIATSAAVGAGAFTIQRSDGKVIIVHGGGLTTGSIWDGVAGGTMSAPLTAPGNAALAGGALGLLRPDGLWLIVNGGKSTASSLYDPYGVTATAAGPTLTSCTASAGTNAMLMASGSYVILCGGTGNWGVYNPVGVAYTAGTALGVSFGSGSLTLQRDDGTFLVFSGGNTSSHYLYTPWGHSLGVWSAVNPITSNAPTIGSGAFSIRRADGKFLIVGRTVNASTVYDPRTTSTGQPGTFTAQSGAGYGPTAFLGDGAHAIWRPDGKYLTIHGNSTTSTDTINPSAVGNTQFVAGPTLGTAVRAGGHSILSASGSVRIIAGASTTTTMNYKMGFIVGGPSTSTGSIYESECITSAALNSGSTLNWNANADDSLIFQVRTGNGSCPAGVTGYKAIDQHNGRLIRPTPGDNRVQMRVIFKRPLPVMADQEWGLIRGFGQTHYRKIQKYSTLYDVEVRNTNLLRRTQFDFGASGDPSGPVGVNIANDANRNLKIQLANNALIGSTLSVTSTAQNLNNGVFIRHSPLAQAAALGTVVMKRPDGKFVVIAGGGAANAQLYDQNAQTFSLMTSNPGLPTGSGALAFKRPDGKFLIVLGRGTRRSSIYDPLANTFTSGPLLTNTVGDGALAFPLPNGRVLVAHGALTRISSIYDPYLNTFSTGALMVTNLGRGSSAVPIQDGSWLVTPGQTSAACALTTLTYLFFPYQMLFTANAGVVHTTGVGPGSLAFQRTDGNWQIVHGGGNAAGTCAASTRTSLFNVRGNRIAVGGVLSAAARFGTLAMPRPDGTTLVVHGGGATTTTIFQDTSGAFTADAGGMVGVGVAGPTLHTAVGSGAVAFQRDDGKYVVLSAQTTAGSPAGTTTVQLYDPGWVANGFYRSENMYVPDLDSDSTLTWKGSDLGNISALVRTGTSSLLLQVQPSRVIANPGTKLNPRSTAEKWVQVEFSLKRTFPSYGGIWDDVWYNGGTHNNIPLRTLATPTITEFSINKDKDLVNLQADRLSLFRVNSNGDIYSGAKGSINTGGADLAERYFSQDDLNPGELVAIDYLRDHGVRLSKAAYQWDLLGVVSSNPGFIAGAFTLGSHPVALVGRVPAWVSLENGTVNPGDRLTSSGVAGTAMKATKAGRVVGVALSAVDPTTVGPCARDKNKQCGQVMIFLNLSDWPGPAQ